MAPLSTDAISHFTHPSHKLYHLTTNTPYNCDGCNLRGTGPRFTCTICDFDLHDFCAKCPTRFTSTINHQHPMSLVIHKPKTNQSESCQICHGSINGLAYQCKDCNFWAHTLCVSTNSGHNQDRALPVGRAPAAASIPHNQDRALPVGRAPAAQSKRQQVALGLATNGIYDILKAAFESSSS